MELLHITDGYLCDMILNGKNEVKYISSGISEAVANSIVKFQNNNKHSVIEITIDYASSNVNLRANLFVALDILNKNNIELIRGEDVKISFLKVDDEIVVFDAMSVFITSSKYKNAIKFNLVKDIIVSKVDITNIMNIDSENLFEMLNKSSEQAKTQNNEIKKNITTEEIKEQKEKNNKLLEENENEKKLREMRESIQHIDITFKGSNISRRIIQLPSDLLDFTENKENVDKIKATYKLFDKNIEFNYPNIKKELDSIKEKYIISLGSGYGNIIKKCDKKSFEDDFESLQKKLDKEKDDVLKKIEKEMEKAQDNIVEILVPLIEKKYESIKDNNKNYNREDYEKDAKIIASRIIPQPVELIINTDLKYVYKDISLETATSKRFVNILYDKLDKFERNKYYQRSIFNA